MKSPVSAVSVAIKKGIPALLAITVALFLSALVAKWAVVLSSPSGISHNNPLVMAMAFATLYFGTGAYILRQQFIQMGGILRTLAYTEVHLQLPQILRSKG